MTFTCRVVEGNEEKIKLSYPDNVLKNLQRKYERVQPPEGIELRFSVDNVKVVLFVSGVGNICKAGGFQR